MRTYLFMCLHLFIFLSSLRCKVSLVLYPDGGECDCDVGITVRYLLQLLVELNRIKMTSDFHLFSFFKYFT